MVKEIFNPITCPKDGLIYDIEDCEKCSVFPCDERKTWKPHSMGKSLDEIFDEIFDELFDELFG
ncbi:MAG: hypothetical protein ACETWM_00310 [Candidatus Lokiarchaeia archaeon]